MTGTDGVLADWSVGEHTHAGVTHRTYRRGEGPGVVLVHELPGITPSVVGFADELVAAGYTVVMPSLLGTPGEPMSGRALARSMTRACVSREFTLLALGETSPVAGWLRDLARALHQELGGKGVGAVGMCFTGGFALAMTVEPAVVAPVLAQPSLPFPVTRARAADVNLSPADLAVVRQRAREGQQVLGVCYRSDRAVGTRFATLTSELGDAFLRVELEGTGHSTLTEQRDQEAVDRVLAFLADHLA